MCEDFSSFNSTYWSLDQEIDLLVVDCEQNDGITLPVNPQLAQRTTSSPEDTESFRATEDKELSFERIANESFGPLLSVDNLPFTPMPDCFVVPARISPSLPVAYDSPLVPEIENLFEFHLEDHQQLQPLLNSPEFLAVPNSLLPAKTPATSTHSNRPERSSRKTGTVSNRKISNTKASQTIAIVRSTQLILRGIKKPFNTDFSINQHVLKNNGKIESNVNYSRDIIGACIKGQYYLNCKHNLALKLETKNANVVITQLIVHIDNKLLYDLSIRGCNGFSLSKNQTQLKSVKKEILKALEISITVEYTLNGEFYNTIYEQPLTVCGHDFIRQEMKKLGAI